MILDVYLRDIGSQINSKNVFQLEKVRIGYIQNIVERVVKADNNQNFMELYLKRGLF